MSRRSYTDEELRYAVASNTSMAGTLRALGLVPRGGNYQSVRARVQELGLETSHWSGEAHLRGKHHGWARTRSLAEILVEESSYRSRHTLKRRLVREGLLEERCATEACLFHAAPLVYLGKPLVLHLDHINGDGRDQRLENLRLLCPLCHSQTDTYTGRNVGRYARSGRGCVDCGARTGSTLRCPACRARLGADLARRTRCVDCGSPLKRGRTRCRSCHVATLRERGASRGRPTERGCVDCGRRVARRSSRCIGCAHRPFVKTEWPTPDELARRVRESSYSAVARALGVSDNAVRKRLRASGVLRSK